FFQAEDGIRDFHVTGVQTCALPIYQEQALDVGCPARFIPILKGAAEAMGGGQFHLTGLIALDTVGSLVRHVARQEGMVDVKQQRQQRQDQLLPSVEGGMGALESALADFQEAVADNLEGFAIDAFVIVGLDNALDIHAIEYRCNWKPRMFSLQLICDLKVYWDFIRRDW